MKNSSLAFSYEATKPRASSYHSMVQHHSSHKTTKTEHIFNEALLKKEEFFAKNPNSMFCLLVKKGDFIKTGYFTILHSQELQRLEKSTHYYFMIAMRPCSNSMAKAPCIDCNKIQITATCAEHSLDSPLCVLELTPTTRSNSHCDITNDEKTTELSAEEAQESPSMEKDNTSIKSPVVKRQRKHKSNKITEVQCDKTSLFKITEKVSAKFSNEKEHNVVAQKVQIQYLSDKNNGKKIQFTVHYDNQVVQSFYAKCFAHPFSGKSDEEEPFNDIGATSTVPITPSINEYHGRNRLKSGMEELEQHGDLKQTPIVIQQPSSENKVQQQHQAYSSVLGKRKQLPHEHHVHEHSSNDTTMVDDQSLLTAAKDSLEHSKQLFKELMNRTEAAAQRFSSQDDNQLYQQQQQTLQHLLKHKLAIDSQILQQLTYMESLPAPSSSSQHLFTPGCTTPAPQQQIQQTIQYDPPNYTSIQQHDSAQHNLVNSSQFQHMTTISHQQQCNYIHQNALFTIGYQQGALSTSNSANTQQQNETWFEEFGIASQQ